jgi:hypothetical protein
MARIEPNGSPEEIPAAPEPVRLQDLVEAVGEMAEPIKPDCRGDGGDEAEEPEISLADL